MEQADDAIHYACSDPQMRSQRHADTLPACAAQEKLEELGPNGRVHIEVRYLPFVAPEVQEEAMKKLEKERLKNNAKTQLRRRATKSTMDMRGVLTVTVHRCINLEARACRASVRCSSS